MPAYSGGKTCLLGQTKGCAVSANCEETRAGREEGRRKEQKSSWHGGVSPNHATCRAGSGQGGRGGGEGARRMGTDGGKAGRVTGGPGDREKRRQ